MLNISSRTNNIINIKQLINITYFFAFNYLVIYLIFRMTYSSIELKQFFLSS